MRYLIVSTAVLSKEIRSIDDQAIMVIDRAWIVSTQLRLDQLKLRLSASVSKCGKLIVTELAEDNCLGLEGPEKCENNELASPLKELSRRELEIFELVGQAKGRTEIAKQLHLSVHTIETHRDNIKRKLHLSSYLEVVRAAILAANR